MAIYDHSGPEPSARLLLRELGDFEATKPVRDLLAHRRSHDDVEPEDWLTALEEADGQISIHFYLEADHEWWLAYDADPDPGEYDDEHGLEGPYHHWTTYPSGPWNHQEKPRGVLLINIADAVYWEGDPPDRCDIYRSKVVSVREAPEFVRNRVGDEPPDWESQRGVR